MCIHIYLQHESAFKTFYFEKIKKNFKHMAFQSCPTLFNPMDCNLLLIHGILQARTLEWVAMPPPGDFDNKGIKPVSPGSPGLQVDSLPTEPLGKPMFHVGTTAKY